MSEPQKIPTEPEVPITSAAQGENIDVDAAAEAPEVKPEIADVDLENDTEVKPEKDAAQNGGRKKGKFVTVDGKKLPVYDNGVLKTSVDAIIGKNNSRYDPSVLPESEDAHKIRAQVEFYFSDSNLVTDEHMLKESEGTKNTPIPLSDILGFGRMKRFKNRAAVAAALKASEFVKVTGDEGEEAISRVVAYDPTILARGAKLVARSVYVKGFGDEEPSSQFDIEAFFAPYGPTNTIRLRRTDDKAFKGSVWVEFQDEALAKKFIALDPQPKWKGIFPMIIMSKAAYMEMKEADIKSGKIQPHGQTGRGRGRGRGNGHKGGNRDPNDWKKRREDDQANGFKSGHNAKHRGSKKGRGNRGGRGDRKNRNDRNAEAAAKEAETATPAPAAQAEVKVEVKSEPTPSTKRAREDDTTEAPPAKKVDTKTES